MLKQITELQAVAQSGLCFAKDKFDIARYERIIEIAAKLFELNSNHKYDEILELFREDNGYATPKMDVRGAAFRDNEILLVQEAADNLWSLPGGWADVNLSPSENIIKEIYEEAGFESTVIKLIRIYDKNKDPRISRWPHVYRMFFLCELKNSAPLPFDKNEILDMNFFGINELPPLSLGRVNKEQIEVCFKHHYNQNLITEFD